MIPIITVLGLQFGALLAGAIVTETIFSWPGIGRLTIQAISDVYKRQPPKICKPEARSPYCSTT